jgi:D-aspartate ligase
VSPTLDTSRPVLLLDGGSRLDLGIVRSLGLAGVPVHLLCADSHSITATSRYVTAVHPFPPREASAESCLRQLRATARALSPRPIILPTGDQALQFLSDRRDDFADLVDHDLPAAAVVDHCIRKDRFARWAARAGVPVPPTFVPRDAAHVRAAAGDMAFPVFVKPWVHEHWDRLPLGIVGHVRGERVDSAADLIGLFDQLESQGNDAHHAVVQQFVPGTDREHVDVHAYIDGAGSVLGAFSARKLRIWPPHRGLGVLVRSERLSAAVEVTLCALQRLGVTGMANVNLKFDPIRGAYRVLEINCRYSTWTELPTRCGCNFPLVAYAAITGQEPPLLHQREGIEWLDFKRDWEAMATYRREHEWSWLAYFGSLVNVRHGAFFAWDDPAPFFSSLARRVTGPAIQ